jgi:hypothetical protein
LEAPDGRKSESFAAISVKPNSSHNWWSSVKFVSVRSRFLSLFRMWHEIFVACFGGFSDRYYEVTCFHTSDPDFCILSPELNNNSHSCAANLAQIIFMAKQCHERRNPWINGSSVKCGNDVQSLNILLWSSSIPQESQDIFEDT